MTEKPTLLPDREIYRRAALDVEIALSAIRRAISRLDGRTWAGRLESAAETLEDAAKGLHSDSVG